MNDSYRDHVERVRAASSVEAVLRERYDRDANEQHYVLCPFHPDTHPSMSVTDALYHCFSCQAGGDVFHLVQQLEKTSFSGAVAKLAEWAGISRRPQVFDREAVERARLIADATEWAAGYYETRMTAEATAYLTEQRGLPRDLMVEARCGWADGFLVEMARHLGGEDPAQILIAAGLAIERRNVATWTSESAERDWIRDRVVIPSLHHGRAVFLSGRTLQAGVEPKYLHQRGRPAPLFNLDAVRSETLIVVEGQLDALSLMAWKLPVVGLMGTPHTSQLAGLRQSKRLYVCTDPDTAGREAAYKLAAAIDPFQVRLIMLPPGVDPNDFYRQNPRSAFLQLMEAAKPAVDVALSEVPAGDMMGLVGSKVFPLLDAAPPHQAEVFLDTIASTWGKGHRGISREIHTAWLRYRQSNAFRCPGCGMVLPHGPR